MAELAFETIIRVFIAIAVLGLISVILSSIFSSLNDRVHVELTKQMELPVVVDASSLKAEDINSYAIACRNYFHENTPVYSVEPCFVFKNIKYTELSKVNESLIEVRNTYTNAIMSYDATRDKVIVE